MNSFFRIFCGLSAIVTTIVCLIMLSGVFAYAFLLPIAFFLFLNFVNLTRIIWQCRPLTAYIITGLLWVRMVFLPLYGALTGAYTSNNASQELSQHFIGAVSLCFYDCIAVAVVLLLFTSKNNMTGHSNITQGLYGQPGVYFLFVILALALFLTVGRTMNLFDFIIKPIAEDLERGEELMGGRELIIRQFVGSGLVFLFLLVLAWLKHKHDSSMNSRYFYWSLICASLFIAVIVGERRTSLLYKAFASGFVLLSLYPDKGRKTVSFIGVAALIVIAAMTIYKQFYGFMYSSYAEALQNVSMAQGFSYGLMDAYFYGIETVAKNIHYGRMMNLGIGQFIYDIVRNSFGINFFIPGGRLLTTQIYNNIIYSGEQLTGLLLSSSGYGFIFFGYAFAPVITVFNAGIMLFFEKCLRRSKTIEWQYVFAFLFIRFGFGFLGATPPLINFVTRFFVINALIIGAARMFKTRSSI